MNHRLLLVCLLLSTGLCFGQNKADRRTWSGIESAIRDKKNLQLVYDTVSLLKQQALQTNNLAVAGRCMFYLMQIADQRTEDTLYFKNSLFIDSILDTPQSPPLLKAVMHLLKASRLYNYSARFYSRSNKGLIRSYSNRYDYSKLSKPELDTLISQHYQAALEISLHLPDAPVGELLWLSGNPLNFLFKPDFSDIVYGERVRMFQLRADMNYRSSNPGWLSLTPDQLMGLPDTLGLFTPQEQLVFRLYKQWMQYHRPQEPAASYFIETLARKFFYHRISPDSAAMRSYEAYLLENTGSPYGTVKAHVVLQLCQLWSNAAEKYNPSATMYGPNLYARFDSTYRLYYVRALELFARHEQLLDSFYYIKNELLSLREEILASRLDLHTKDVWLPNRPVAGFIQYKNVAQVYTRIIRLNLSEVLLADKDRNLSRFLQLPAVVENHQSLKPPPDHQWHNAYLKMPSLPAGRYILLYSDTVITGQPARVKYLELNVTNIAVINSDDRVYVLDRTTGFPLQHATVSVIHNRGYTAGSALKPARKKAILPVNKDGYVTIDRKDLYEVKVYNQNDSLEADINESEADTPEEVYSKEEYDDLMEYYEENIELQLFTDRAIYRPGQTVFYKGIFTVRHPKTGEWLILNWHNLKFPFYKKLLYKLIVKFSKQRIELMVNDPFNRAIDTLRVLPGKFGSFSGSFVLPKQAATGEWDIDMDDFKQAGENSGRFRVEEYQRPTFEINLVKPVTELYLGDQFQVKAKVVSFAAAALSNTKINYRVSRSGQLPVTDVSGYPVTSTEGTVLLDSGQAYTDEKGEWIISVHDSLLKQLSFTSDRKWEAWYDIEVEAVAATGESHEADTKITLSTRPLTINIPLASTIDRSELAPLFISVKSDFAGPVKKKVEVKIYALRSSATGVRQTTWPEADTWLYAEADLQRTFPAIDFHPANQQPESRQLIYTTSILAGEDKLVLPQALLQSGHYSMEVVCSSQEKILGEATRQFTVFDRRARTLPPQTLSFNYMPFNQVKKGKSATWITGTSQQDLYSVYHAAYYTRSGKRTAIQNQYDNRWETKGANEWQFTVPQQAIDRIVLTHLYIFDNNLYREEQTVFVADQSTRPDIVVEQYRKQLVPGGKETFVVSVKTKNERSAAELMTTMYDASLDKLVAHTWQLPRNNTRFYARNNWNNSITTQISSELYSQKNLLVTRQVPQQPATWWFDTLTTGSIETYSYPGIGEQDGRYYGALMGRTPGVAIDGSANLNDVIVVGYGTALRRNLTAGTSIVIRGAASLSEYSHTLVILDGVPYEGDISAINASTITEGIVLKGADATAIYGARAANGVLVLSTKGPVQLTELQKEPPPPVIRKSFAETAFFYPQIHADRHGYYTVSFTLPESVTRWKWKMLAHTKDARFAYAEKELYSQLPLMVQPAVPRFLYQGDKIILKSRITNLDTTDASGILTCSIEDVVTGEDISRQLLAASQQPFSVRQQSNINGAFALTVPGNLLHPLRIKISGTARNYSDGEEHVISILAKKILTVSTVQLILDREKEQKVFPPLLPTDAEPYGMGLYITPKPQAALLNSLPYLAYYPYGCAEQTANKLLAHALAINIVRTDTAAQHLVHANKALAQDAAGEKIPDQIDEQAMPWLQLNQLAKVQQQKLNKLLDTLESHRQIEKYFSQLEDMQNSDGGISWFKGGQSNNHISVYLLAEWGKLQRDGLLLLEKNTAETKLPRLLSRLIRYCDTGFIEQAPGNQFIDYAYARVFWLKQYPLSARASSKLDSLLDKFWERPDTYSLGRQAVMITATLLYAPDKTRLVQAAHQQLESIRQQAIADSVYGIRWKSIADEEDLTTQTEEWVVKIAEAFRTGGGSEETVKGIITWLLRAKQTHGWSTTKSTAEAVGLLVSQRNPMPGSPAQLEMGVDNSMLRVTNGLLSGNSYAFTDRSAKPFPDSSIVRRGEADPVSGALTYYFTAMPPTASDQGVHLSKALFRYNKTTRGWDAVDTATRLRIADKIKVVLTIESNRLLQYVFIDDKRAAALEPADALSGYRYENGVPFYASVKDASMLFFADKISAGVHTFSYETVVAQEGLFTNGAALLQCMYQPDVRAYSTGRRIAVEQEIAP
ncbi:MAG: TonB-dependent receptor plug domain-containing protein [Williamsia sp.]|nr:TonB-dependent receptor plug domain-containing protein [Williamsia sp.]